MLGKETEYIKLLEIFIQVVEANKGKPVGSDEWILDAEGLALKFCAHVASAFYLFKGTSIRKMSFGDIKFFDSASINVVSRAAFETFLIFHHIFIQPTSIGEREFRYISWVLSGLIERQSFPILSQGGKIQIAHEKQMIDSYIDRLKINEHFEALSPKQKRTIIEKGNWRFSGWADLAVKAGLDPTHGTSFYKYLCGYAHSSNLSAFQIREAQSKHIQKELSASAMTLLMISMANMIKAYCDLFPQSAPVLKRNQDSITLVNIWIGVGSSSVKDAEVDWDNIV
jgi:hypothetical protein